MDNLGWIKLHRKMTEWEWYTDGNTFRVFMHLLLIVNHKDKKYRGQVIKRGQTNRSLDTLAIELKLTKNKIRTAISKLVITREITQQRVGNLFLISVVFYDKYQDSETEITQQTTQGITQQPHSNHTATTLNKNNKNDKNEKNTNIELAKKPKISLNELSVDHIAEWLNEKRSQGYYVDIDERLVLESLKDYCKSHKKRYTDYVAAYRNFIRKAGEYSQKTKQHQPNKAEQGRSVAEKVLAERWGH